MARLRIFAMMSLLALPACMQSLEEQAKPTGSIIGKKTQDIGEFDPNEKQNISDSQVKVDDPVLGSLQAYRPILEQASKLQVEHTLNLFNAEHDRYPKDHAEFMSKIIKENNIQLPVLPGEWKYEYDVANHQLVVVEKIKEKGAEKVAQ